MAAEGAVAAEEDTAPRPVRRHMTNLPTACCSSTRMKLAEVGEAEQVPELVLGILRCGLPVTMPIKYGSTAKQGAAFWKGYLVASSLFGP